MTTHASKKTGSPGGKRQTKQTADISSSATARTKMKLGGKQQEIPTAAEIAPDDDFARHYDDVSELPELNSADISRLVKTPEGEQLSEELAKNEHIRLNRYSKAAAEAVLEQVADQILATKSELARALDIRAAQTPHKQAPTAEPNVENALYPWFQMLAIYFAIAIGIPLISTTFAAIITRGGKFDFLVIHPYLSLMFIFVPVSAMILIGHSYEKLPFQSQRDTFSKRLYWLIGLLIAAWVATFLPAYTPSTDSDGFGEPLEVDLFFSVHLTIQVCLEIAIGGALKAAYFDNRRNYYEFENFADPSRAAADMHVVRLVGELADLNARDARVRKYIEDQEATQRVAVIRARGVFEELRNESEKVRERDLARAKVVQLRNELSNAENVVDLFEIHENQGT